MEDGSASRQRAGQALLGFLLVLSGPIVYGLLIDQPFLRSTGAAAFTLIGAGALLGVLAARRDRRSSIRILCAVDLIALPLAMVLFFTLSALPDSPTFGELGVAPDFTLTDHRGQSVSLHEARAIGPVLLVFFRGSW